MSKIIDELISELTTDIDKLKINISDDDFSLIMQWVFDEYKNYMMISRDEFTKTLDAILLSDDASPIFQLLKDNIERYGATQAFYRVAHSYIAT